jgi:hypothetical protein
MGRIGKGRNPGPVAVRRLAAKKSGPGAHNGAANGKPHPVQRVTEFPKSPLHVACIHNPAHACRLQVVNRTVRLQ